MQTDNTSHVLCTESSESTSENIDDTFWFFRLFKKKNISISEMEIELPSAKSSAVNKNHDSSQDEDVNITAIDKFTDGTRQRKKDTINNKKPRDKNTSKDQSIDDNDNLKWYSFMIPIVNWISRSFSSVKQKKINESISDLKIQDDLLSVNPNYVFSETNNNPIDTELDEVVVFNTTDIKKFNPNKQNDDSKQNEEIERNDISNKKNEQKEDDYCDEKCYKDFFNRTCDSFLDSFEKNNTKSNYIKSKKIKISKPTLSRFDGHIIRMQRQQNDEKLKHADDDDANKGFIKIMTKIFSRIPELIRKLLRIKKSNEEIKKVCKEEKVKPKEITRFTERQFIVDDEIYNHGPIENVERCYKLPVFISINYKPWKKKILAAVLKSSDEKVLHDNYERREKLFGDNIDNRKKPIVTMEQAQRALEKIERKKLQEFNWRMEARQYWSNNKMYNSEIINDDYDKYVDDNNEIRNVDGNDEILLFKGDLTDKRDCDVESSDEFDDDNYSVQGDDGNYSEQDDDDDDNNYLEQYDDKNMT